MSSSSMQIDHVGSQYSLSIAQVTGDDEGEYSCEARNELGVASTVQQLLVNCIANLCFRLILSSGSVCDSRVELVCR